MCGSHNRTALTYCPKVWGFFYLHQRATIRTIATRKKISAWGIILAIARQY